MDLRSQLKARSAFALELDSAKWEPTRLLTALTFVKQRLVDTGQKPPPQLRIEQARADLLTAWKRERSLQAVSPRVLRLVPFFVFQGDAERGLEPVAADPAFRGAYLGWIRDKNRSTALALLVKAFLQAYPHEEPWFTAWRDSLSRELNTSGGAAVERWRVRATRFGLLAQEGANHFCQVTLGAKEPPQAVLAEAGLDGDLAHSLFLYRALEHALAELAREMTEGRRADLLERCLLFLQSDASGNLRFDRLRWRFASALLTPFRAEDPAPELKSRIQQVLLATLGDPRITPAPWHQVADADCQTMLRWLTAVAFETFMQVLDMTADERWGARREFWEAYLPKNDTRGALVEAWPVFGADAAKLARTRLEMDSNLFGRVPTTDRRQSVLIMRLRGPWGAVTVCEWSHSGAVRLWNSEDDEAPPFYRSSYTVRQLRGATTDWFAHDVHGAWQRKMSERIFAETGARPRMGKP